MSEKRNIVIVNQYGSTPRCGRRMRHSVLSEQLVSSGYSVTFVIAGNNPVHTTDYSFSRGVKQWQENGVNIFSIGLPPHNGSNVRRLLTWFQFALQLLWYYRTIFSNANMIIYSSISLPGVMSILLIKLFKNVSVAFEFRDIWPLTLRELKNISNFHPMYLLLRLIELAAYKYSDVIICTMPGGEEHVSRSLRRHANVHWVPNGADLHDYIDVNSHLSRKKFIVGYIGSIGVANRIDTLVKTAQLAKGIPDIKFVIIGDGKEKLKLAKYCRSNLLSNIKFEPAIPQLNVHATLSKFDLLYHGSNASGLYQFGISPNKISEYFVAGRPIINSYSGKYDPITAENAGLTSEANDAAALLKNILYLRDNPEIRVRMGENARDAALKTYCFDEVYKKFERIILERLKV